ncbi:Ras-related protein Rab-9B-like [Oopsacas minuta]|uniref:Ras-related protein Rab-9B-like n=1 Tax=Oopsacas minuta TaxID=111878 RepID=A0AAV7JXK5_9METZ|nr:Ras-related protein Rab-9B-like [Oopsacas minuta]
MVELIWDTAGQERFKSLRTPFYRGADCCILTFAVNDKQSFANIDFWKKEFLYYADIRDTNNFPFIVIGNKIDLGQERTVSEEEASIWCGNQSIPYYQTSAKTSENVNIAFFHALEIFAGSAPGQKIEKYQSVNLST